MTLSIGIVGLPNVGKSTLFNALTKNNVLSANYPFATIEPNVGIIELKDERVDNLAKICDSKKKIYATVEFVDIAGIVKDANKGEGLGNQFLSNIRTTNAICQVVRAFSDKNITHVSQEINPENDIEIINTELILSDLQIIEGFLEKSQKMIRGGKINQKEIDEIEKAKKILEDGELLYPHYINDEFNEDYIGQLQHLGLITLKPFIYVFNVDQDILDDENKKNELKAIIDKVTNTNSATASSSTSKKSPVKTIFLDAKFEQELSELEDDEALELLQETGQTESGLNKLAKAGFDSLGQQMFFTAGEKETRAWVINKGDKAPKAAGVIHTDFERGFIKAEVISYNDLIESGSYLEAKNNGKIRLEGKDYVMQENDVVEFKFNV